MRTPGVSVSLHNLIEMDGPGCVWPGCEMRATEKAHFHSKGAGGTPDGRRNVIENQGGMCWAHARMSDGQQPGGWPAFKQAHNALFGEGWEWRIPMDRWGFERAEALTALVAKRRRAVKEDDMDFETELRRRIETLTVAARREYDQFATCPICEERVDGFFLRAAGIGNPRSGTFRKCSAGHEWRWPKSEHPWPDIIREAVSLFEELGLR